MKHVHYEILPASENPLYEEREAGRSHTAFYYERILFEQVKSGNVEAVSDYYDSYISSGFTIGNMSFDDMRRFRYWAVSGISVATHYAILGGADETDVFNLSDQCIRYVDTAEDENQIFIFLKEKLIELTAMVYTAKLNYTKSPIIRHVLHYIHLNLHQKLSLAEIASDASISPNYLSALFKKEIGITLQKYIKKEKLSAAKQRLNEGISIQQVAYEFGFCSESHFIESYKELYNTTPGKAVRSLEN